eukprot:scaffold66164_cov30-Tisochrysis_lutea.AAC.2
MSSVKLEVQAAPRPSLRLPRRHGRLAAGLLAHTPILPPAGARPTSDTLARGERVDTCSSLARCPLLVSTPASLRIGWRPCIDQYPRLMFLFQTHVPSNATGHFLNTGRDTERMHDSKHPRQHRCSAALFWTALLFPPPLAPTTLSETTNEEGFSDNGAELLPTLDCASPPRGLRSMQRKPQPGHIRRWCDWRTFAGHSCAAGTRRRQCTLRPQQEQREGGSPRPLMNTVSPFSFEAFSGGKMEEELSRLQLAA